MKLRHSTPGSARIGALLALTAVAVSATLTGCSPASSGGEEQNGQDVIPLVVARGQVNIENAILAQEQGFFSDAGLDVTMKVGQGAD
ncbi:ABC transporter substrate-binding protein [Paramicrobacterium fandaimingii]|uniref:ABC transporter substrate-binding protein n=1 Tax=Paramicrobacterium fandaimingii TaxID=2708079 RepID=UPI00141F0741|nr:ABC transporter substrate-binding protein [Microbacterium fandaimingii]